MLAPACCALSKHTRYVLSEIGNRYMAHWLHVRLQLSQDPDSRSSRSANLGACAWLRACLTQNMACTQLCICAFLSHCLSATTDVAACRFTSAPKSANRNASDDGSLDSPSSASGQPGSPSWSQVDIGNATCHTFVHAHSVWAPCPTCEMLCEITCRLPLIESAPNQALTVC